MMSAEKKQKLFRLYCAVVGGLINGSKGLEEEHTSFVCCVRLCCQNYGGGTNTVVHHHRSGEHSTVLMADGPFKPYGIDSTLCLLSNKGQILCYVFVFFEEEYFFLDIQFLVSNHLCPIKSY